MKSQLEWRDWCRQGNRPANVPSGPHRTYAEEGWLSWADWLGFGIGEVPKNEFLTFHEARAQVQRHGPMRHSFCSSTIGEVVLQCVGLTVCAKQTAFAVAELHIFRYRRFVDTMQLDTNSWDC